MNEAYSDNNKESQLHGCKRNTVPQWWGATIVIERCLVKASLNVLRFVIEQDFIICLVLVQPKKNRYSRLPSK